LDAHFVTDGSLRSERAIKLAGDERRRQFSHQYIQSQNRAFIKLKT
jgi:hypothetical protein